MCKWREIKRTVVVVLAAGLLSMFQARADSVISVLAETYGLQPATPDAAQLRYGTYWYLLQGQFLVPYPGARIEPYLQIYSLGDGVSFLVDENTQPASGVNYARLEVDMNWLLAALALAGDGGGDMMMASSLASSYWYGNPAYMTNLVVTSAGNQSMTASFSIGGGTNFVPYDIWTTTNLLNQIAQSQWNWLGIGYTTYRYTFTNQPTGQAFYALAQPQKTMVVAWGDNTLAQCEVPFGITNAVAVAGGSGHSLALLNNGTVVAWGDTNQAPTDLVGVAMVAAGWNHDVALLTNGTVRAWGTSAFGLLNVPADLTNATVVSAQALNTLALRKDGTVVAWGDNGFGQTDVPTGLSNVTAIAAGGEHCLAVSNGTVVAWGSNNYGQRNVPSGLANVWDVAASGFHSLALKQDGTVVAWGDNSYGETNVPAGLSNVVAISASGDPFDYRGLALPYSLALKSDGTVVGWGAGFDFGPVDGLTNVIAISAGVYHALAVRTGPLTPVITVEPVNQYQLAGGSVTFTTRGLGLYGVTYQWQSNNVNIAAATNTTLALTNVQGSFNANYRAVVSDSYGSIISSNAAFALVTPPVLVSQSTPTNPVYIYGNYVGMSAVFRAPGDLNGFPISYQWQHAGTNLLGATNASYGFYVDDNSVGEYNLIASNAVGSNNAVWQVTITNAINVTNDVLIIYNTNSDDSKWVKDYYLDHRPMIAGANVLGIGCTNWHSIFPADYTNQIAVPVQNWLAANPTKRPQYVILMAGIPWRVNTNPYTLWGNYAGGPVFDTNFVLIANPVRNSVQYQISTSCSPLWKPFVTSINMGTLTNIGGVDYAVYTNACKAYIDKLESIGTNGNITISASATGYDNTNYVVDSVRHGTTYTNDDFSLSTKVSTATNGLIASGVPQDAIIFSDGLDQKTNGIFYNGPHITNAPNVSGYISWGAHSALNNEYALPGSGLPVKWQMNSGWWIIETIESFNGQPGAGMGDFFQWFSSNAFGGTSYSSTPVGAVTHVDEPELSLVNDPASFFGLWAAGKNFAICAWKSSKTVYFQAVGDPLVER